MLRLPALLSATLISGCSLTGDPSVLEVSSNGVAVSVQNVSDQSVSYLAVESATAARYDVGDSSRWPTFAPGEGYHGPPTDFAIGFDRGDTEFVLFYDAGGDVRRERVRL